MDNMKGAEAIISFSHLLGKKVAIKTRDPKNYRAKEIDTNLRKIRTRVEARLLHKAKIAGVLCPTVLCIEDFALWLSFIKGNRPKLNQDFAKKAAEILAKLHSNNIIHGDFTPANLIKNKTLYLVDFGLGFFSSDVEDKAIDVLTMLKSLEEESLKKTFLSDYIANYKKSKDVLKRIKVVESRVRYF